ncbi:MAG: hypothetical protein IRY83_07250 [Chloroflexi bacterium]|nr:hypothetical protein [Chloroflexota bacterium]
MSTRDGLPAEGLHPGRPPRARAIAGPHPTTVLIRLSLLLGATAGFSLGLVLLGAVVLGQASAVPWAALAQVHGQVQAIGFVALFILGTAAQLLPGFLACPLTRPGRVTLGGGLIAGAMVVRAVAQPLWPGPARVALLWASAAGEVVGFALCLVVYAELARQTIQPLDRWRELAAAGFGFLVVSLIVNTAAIAWLAGGAPVVPGMLDAALVQLQLAGFVVFLVFGVSRKILPRFLLLRPPNDRLISAGGIAYGSGVALVAAGWLMASVSLPDWVGSGASAVGVWLQLMGTILYLGGLRLYEPPVRPSGAPAVTDPARRWIRIAFIWLIVADLLALIPATRAFLGGPSVGFYELTAERHALAQGFIVTIIIAYASRILPGFSAWAIQHPRTVALIVALVTAGAVVRVIGELLTAWITPAGETVAGAGGALGVAGFLLFAAFLFRTIGRIPRPSGRASAAASR